MRDFDPHDASVEVIIAELREAARKILADPDHHYQAYVEYAAQSMRLLDVHETSAFAHTGRPMN